MNAMHFRPDQGMADATFSWHRWIDGDGFYLVCLVFNMGEGFCDWAMRAVVDDFGNLIRVPS